MLDFDLADAYGVKTAQLKRQVRRNIERFEGDDFMFEVTADELSRCQIGTLNIKRGQNIKYLPKKRKNSVNQLVIPPFRNAGKGKKRNKTKLH